MKRIFVIIISLATLMFFCFSFAPAAQYDPIVYQAQKALKSRVYNSDTPDGLWGKSTESPIKHFQVDTRLPVTVDAGEDKSLDIRLEKLVSLGSKVRDVWKDPITGMEFVWAPGGCYEMGCGDWTNDCYGDENPVHEVCVDGFWIGKYEVTQGQWEKVMENNPSYFKKGGNYPVEHVSWNHVKDFIGKLNSRGGGNYIFRLPREAEWEYAARSGGKPERYSGGDNIDAVAWHGGNSGRTTHPVGTKAPNGLDIYDMNGNIWEWCEDIYSKTAYRKHQRNNPVYTVGGSFRVIRGGSWGPEPWSVRSAFRGRRTPGSRFYFIGFRLVRTP